MAVLDVPGADVVGHAVSEDVVAHIFLPDMERVPAQDNGQLHFIIQLGDKIQMAVDRLPIAQGPKDIRQAQSLPASSELYLRPMDKLIQTAGSSALPVLIQGAVGTHKGVVARRIHTKSATEGTTLMRLQCRDLTEKNWDMLLNNAASPIHATGYTVYLENVDTLPKDLQQQVGTYIEDTKMTHRHRVISSSCCDLSAEVARGQFSSRLYLQLSGFTINVPSLAQRKEDIPAFVNMMSVMPCESSLTMWRILKNTWSVTLFCRSSPLTKLLMDSAGGQGNSSAVTMTGPMAKKVSRLFPRKFCLWRYWTSRALTSLATLYPKM